MKKKLVYSFFGIGILLIILYLFRYKQSLVFTDRVPKDATSIINLNTRQLEHHLLADFISNPICYLKSDINDTLPKDSITHKKYPLTKGINIPRNILFYTNTTNYNNNWYSSIIKLNNPNELSNYLLSKNFKKEKSIFTKGNIIFAIQDKQLVIVVTSNKKLQLSENITAIFNRPKFLSKKSKLLSLIVKNNSDIVYVNYKNDFLEGNFKKGSFVVKGNLNLEFNLFINNAATEINKSSILSLTTRINKKHLFYSVFSNKIKSKFTKLTHLSLDTITNNWNGFLNLDFKEITSKTDSIISYEYDDNFNKIEKIKTQTIEQPNLSIIFGLEKNSTINSYLIKHKGIKIISGDSLFTKLPLYKFYTATSSTHFKLYTHQQVDEKPFKNIKFESYFNIEKYHNSKQKFPFLTTNNTYLSVLKSAHFKLSKDNKLDIVITAVDNKRNLLGLLIKPN